MGAQKLIIPGRLPGYNQLIAGHWTVRNKIKKDSMEVVRWEVKRQRIKPIGGKAAVNIICYEPNRKRDESNVRAGAEKVILDALQKSGIIRNDNPRWLEDRPAKVDYDMENPRIEVEIEEVKE